MTWSDGDIVGDDDQTGIQTFIHSFRIQECIPQECLVTRRPDSGMGRQQAAGRVTFPMNDKWKHCV